MNPEARVIPNPVVGGRYALAGLLFFLMAWWQGGGAWLLLWPGISCAAVTWSYLRGGARIYGKKDGRVSRFSALMLLPTRTGQWASWVYYRGHSTLMDEIVPGVFLGRQPTLSEAEMLIGQGIKRVLDVTAEFSRPAPFRHARYLNLPIPDLTAPTPGQLREGVDFIRESLTAHEPVYVHCKVGYSRSGAMVGAALCELGLAASSAEAIRMLETKRPGIVLRPEARDVLEER